MTITRRFAYINIMETKLCEEFFYRIEDADIDVYKTFNTSPENVIRNNPKLKFYVGEWIKIKVNDYILHHVKPMETLAKIASSYGVSEEEIKKRNELDNVKLFIGQQIKIPIKNN